jgi:hypothetical protein
VVSQARQGGYGTGGKRRQGKAGRGSVGHDAVCRGMTKQARHVETWTAAVWLRLAMKGTVTCGSD